MIKLSNFYIFSNFLRISQEFYDEKAIVKAKSLTFEREFDFQYKDAGEIRDGFLASNDQQSFSYSLTTIMGCTLYILCNWLSSHLIWLRITQFLFMAGLILYITSFIRKWHIFIIDKNDNLLTQIKQTRRNNNLVSDIIQKVKMKSNNLQEVLTSDPFPKESPIFEYNYFRFDDLQKTNDRFYENEIIGLETSINKEIAYKIRYDSLSGKTHSAKVANDLWNLTIPWCVLIIGMVTGLRFGFGINFGIPIFYILYSLLAVMVISLLMTFVKREVFGFYNKKGEVEYWAYVNRNDRKKIEEIINYIQSRIPTDNKANF